MHDGCILVARCAGKRVILRQATDLKFIKRNGTTFIQLKICLDNAEINIIVDH